MSAPPFSRHEATDFVETYRQHLDIPDSVLQLPWAEGNPPPLPMSCPTASHEFYNSSLAVRTAAGKPHYEGLGT